MSYSICVIVCNTQKFGDLANRDPLMTFFFYRELILAYIMSVFHPSKLMNKKSFLLRILKKSPVYSIKFSII